MSRLVFNLYDAKTALSQLVDRAAAGEEIVIAKNGTPLVKLVAVKQPLREPGGWEGNVRISDDFDEPLPPDLLASFMGQR